MPINSTKQVRLSSVEFGSATICLLAQQHSAPTEKMAAKKWNQVAFFLRKQIEVLRAADAAAIKGAVLLEIRKVYQPSGEIHYDTIWKVNDEI